MARASVCCPTPRDLLRPRACSKPTDETREMFPTRFKRSGETGRATWREQTPLVVTRWAVAGLRRPMSVLRAKFVFLFTTCYAVAFRFVPVPDWFHTFPLGSQGTHSEKEWNVVYDIIIYWVENYHMFYERMAIRCHGCNQSNCLHDIRFLF